MEKTMYAIIKTGGKQYRVADGDVIDVELLDGDPGTHVQFSEVLFIYDGSDYFVGEPVVSQFVVTGELIGSISGPKVTSVKYIPGNHRKKIGHRQRYSRLKISIAKAESHHKESLKEGRQHGS
jgi:large subunit ribosomal protein L21